MKENENYTVNVRIIAPDLPDEFVSAIKKHRPLGDEQDQGVTNTSNFLNKNDCRTM